MSKNKLLWFDLTNTSHVHFFRPFFEEFQEDNKLIVTSREFAETLELLEKINIDYKNFGYYAGKNKLKKRIGHIIRSLKLSTYVENYDFSFSHGSVSPILLKYLRDGKLISFYDNEHAESFKLLAKHSDYFFIPKIIEEQAIKFSGENTEIIPYDGIKEQIYLADFKVDESFKNKIPYDHYLVLRAEAWKSDYVDKDEIITFDLAKLLIKNGYNIVFLPRYNEIPKWMKKSDKIFIPKHALNGPQLCWHSDVVLTGSGTLAREATVLGKPSVSFYPSKPLKVDLLLELKGLLYRSRDIYNILQYILSIETNRFMLQNNRSLKYRVFKDIEDIIH